MKRPGRPKLNPADKRVLITAMVSPDTLRKLRDAQKQHNGNAGRALDALLA